MVKQEPSTPVVAAIYTAPPLVPVLKELFPQLLPGVGLINIMDDSLIAEVIRNNGVTPAVELRMLHYFRAAETAGANIIFNTCSSVGEVADKIKTEINISVVKIDEYMAIEAVNRADRIGVLATLPTTLGPTVRLVQAKASDADKKISVAEGLAQGAFQALIAGDSTRHDNIILETAIQAAENADIFVLAQGSMARMQEQLEKETGKTVLTSTRSGVEGLKTELVRLGFQI
jgi:Asp/Glu/hydantoin racemase